MHAWLVFENAQTRKDFRGIIFHFCQILGVHFGANTCRACIRTRANTGKCSRGLFWKISVLLVFQRTPWGGGKKRGVENLTNDTPPKKAFWTPPRTVRFPPPSRVSALFFLYKNPRQSRAPYTFCTPPPYHVLLVLTWKTKMLEEDCLR